MRCCAWAAAGSWRFRISDTGGKVRGRRIGLGWERRADPSEQIRVCSGANQVQVAAIDFVDQQPIRLDVAIAEVLPVPAERFPRFRASFTSRRNWEPSTG